MIAITLADLRFRYRQFLIAVVGAGVVLAMAVLLSGLADGFQSEIKATVGAVGADRWLLSQQSNGRITSVAAFDQSAVTKLAATPGVQRASGLVFVPLEVVHAGGRTVTVNVMGVEPGGLGHPQVTAGRTFRRRGEIVVDERAGVAVGGTVQLGSITLQVVGTVTDRTLAAGIPMTYMTLVDAQAALFGGRPIVTEVVTSGVPRTVPTGLESLTPAQVERHTLETLASGAASIRNSRTLMWVVAAIIIAALIYVSALQRVRDFAVLKALGSSSTALFGSLCLQAVLITLLAAAFGMAASLFMTGIFDQPVTVQASTYATLPLIAVAVGLIASLIALRRAVGADPVAAFGG